MQARRAQTMQYIYVLMQCHILVCAHATLYLIVCTYYVTHYSKDKKHIFAITPPIDPSPTEVAESYEISMMLYQLTTRSVLLLLHLSEAY